MPANAPLNDYLSKQKSSI